MLLLKVFIQLFKLTKKVALIAGAKDIMVGDDQTDTTELAVGGLFFRQI